MRVALVHDYLTQYGGAERVLETLHAIYPDAPVFTSVLDLNRLPASLASWTIVPSPLQRLPRVERYHRALLPLYRPAFRSFRAQLRAFDLVIADSSAWSHHVHVDHATALICYCHSPARFLYRDPAYLEPAKIPPPAAYLTPPLFAALRRQDRQAAVRVDRYVANSFNVAARISSVYGREATVIHPPVETRRYAPASDIDPEPWYLVVSRLVPHKRIDLAIDACNGSGRRLKIIGDGRAEAMLRGRAGPTIEFLGQLEDAEVIAHLQRCRALILPAAEDFGMTAVEAQAAGRPVIAFDSGGARESVVRNQTGVFFAESTPESLNAAMDSLESRSWDTETIRAQAARFDTGRFVASFTAVVDEVMREKGSTPER